MQSNILPALETRMCWQDDEYKINFGAMKSEAYKNIPELGTRGLNA